MRVPRMMSRHVTLIEADLQTENVLNAMQVLKVATPACQAVRQALFMWQASRGA